tara:strand:+ start:4722 stop:4835 length:114 start_codon:yes stop_codon:yes gene_type:complete
MTNDNENQDENEAVFFMLESSAVVCARIRLQKYIYMR